MQIFAPSQLLCVAWILYFGGGQTINQELRAASQAVLATENHIKQRYPQGYPYHFNADFPHLFSIWLVNNTCPSGVAGIGI